MTKKMFAKGMIATTVISAVLSGQAMSATAIDSGKFLQMNFLKNACTLTDAQATTKVKLHINLNSGSIPPTQSFNPTNTATFNYETQVVIYDSLGVMHLLSMYYIKEVHAANSWKVYTLIDNSDVGTSGYLTFGNSGGLLTKSGLENLSWSPATGAMSPQVISIDMTCSTQYAGNSTVLENMWQNGHASGLNFQDASVSDQSGLSCVAADPEATTQVKLNVNLSATDVTPTTAVFSPQNSSSFNYQIGFMVYDSLGAPYNVKVYFIKDVRPNHWTAKAYLYNTYFGSGELTFDSKGLLVDVTGLANLSFQPYSGATSPQLFDISMTCSSQYGSSDQLIEMPWQNGQAGGNSFHAALAASVKK